jgi:PPOX class probable F420-dependent enzyme
MPRAPLSSEALRLLGQPNPAVIAVVRPDGQPISVATWYLVDDDGRILVNMDGGRRRNAYMKANPRVSLTVLRADDWGTHVSVQGEIVEWRDDNDLTDIDRLAHHYGAGPYHNRERPRVTALIEVNYWHTWGTGLSS